MRIGRVGVENFKSLVGFELAPADLTCLIGLNSAGKSTVLQFLDFLGRQVIGDIEGWLDVRGWKPAEVRSKIQPGKNVSFAVDLVDAAGGAIGSWRAVYNPTLLYCTRESIELPTVQLAVAGGEYVITQRDGKAKAATTARERVAFDYQGSILSQLRADLLPKPLARFRQFFRDIHSLDLLTPEFLRSRTREAAGSLGLGGRQLAAFLHEMTRDDRDRLVRLLKKVYPPLVDVDTESLRAGWKQLDIREQFPSGLTIRTPARHVNDGTLRLLAVLAELASGHSLVMFDEIENGVNPELIEFLIGQLLRARQQVVVTTHSPLVLNYLDDETARRGVVYLYKTANGETRARPFFSIPSLAAKLAVMGPGEAFVDTNLTALAQEIATTEEAGAR